MALISCPECAGRVSDQAATCPHCGHPLAQPNGGTQPITGTQPADRTQPTTPATSDWQAHFREIHSQRGLVEAILYLRQNGVSQKEVRAFLEQEDAAGRIPHLPDSSGS